MRVEKKRQCWTTEHDHWICDGCGVKIEDDWAGKQFSVKIDNTYSDGYDNYGGTVNYDFCAECAKKLLSHLPGIEIEHNGGEGWYLGGPKNVKIIGD